MSDKIRIGLIGASVSSTWSARTHLPALADSPDFELAAVCTTKAESAEAAREAHGARLAFDSYQEMISSPELDAVAVVVRVPSHFHPTLLALEAGKHVLCEWPLARTTEEAERLAAVSGASNVANLVGLQGRVDPGLNFIKQQVAAGGIGEVLSVHLSYLKEGVLERPSGRTWQRDDALGATTLTIAAGHAIDALRFVAGEFTEVAGVVSTQVPTWLETDTQRIVDVTAPDTIAVHGHLDSGAVASAVIGSIPFAGSGFRLEVYGSEGTLVANSSDSPQSAGVSVFQATHGNELEPVAPAESSSEGLKPPAANVARLYALFAEAIRTGTRPEPSFDTALELHRLIDAIRDSSSKRETVRLG